MISELIELLNYRTSFAADTAEELKIIVYFLLFENLLNILIIVYLIWKLLRFRNIENFLNRLSDDRNGLVDRVQQVLSEAPNGNTNSEVMTPLISEYSNSEAIIEEEGGRSQPSILVNNETFPILNETFRIDEGNLQILEDTTIDTTRVFNFLKKGKLAIGNLKKDHKIKKVLDVTVKGALQERCSIQQRRILDELDVLSRNGRHPNILTLVGAVISHKSPILIVCEKIENNLRDYLRKNRRTFVNLMHRAINTNDGYLVTKKHQRYIDEHTLISNDFGTLCTLDLISFAYQIAMGLEYIASKQYVHRHLALQSILITLDKTIRIGDFELARKRNTDGCYRIMSSKVALPFHLLAPETFKNQNFTEATDVYAFAVCLHELFTLGETPYQELKVMLESNDTYLTKPEFCHPEIYEFMKTCWNINAESRPKAGECVTFFEKHIDEYAKQIREQIDEKLQSVSKYQETLEELKKESGTENIAN